MIKWHKVTWYSKWLAIIFFIGVLPVLTFCIGNLYGRVSEQASLLGMQPSYSVPFGRHNKSEFLGTPLSDALISELHGLSVVNTVYEYPSKKDEETSFEQLIYRGDLNSDQYEDAIMFSESCNESCEQNIVVYLNQGGREFKKLVFDEKAGFINSGKSKTQLSSFAVTDGVIAIGMANSNDNGFIVHHYKIINNKIERID